MARFTSNDLSRFSTQGSLEVSIEKPFLVDRYSSAVSAGVPTIDIPDSVNSIRRVTWLGWMLDPLPARNFREVFQGTPQVGWPFWYIYNQIESNTISLFPSPNTDLLAVTGDLWDSLNLQTGLVIEYYRPSNDTDFVVPDWKRRQLLKSYVQKRAYSVDGPGLNLKLAQYHSAKWDSGKVLWYALLDYLYNTPRKISVDASVNGTNFPGFPVLPIDRFGIPVDEGY